jgi:predicted RNase H-like HicB family nuclease
METTAVQLNTEIWKEGNMYVAYVPQLNLASCGKTIEEAEKNIKDATEGFFEVTDKKGTTKEVLEEAGFFYDDEWKAPDIIKLKKMRVAF